MVKLEMGEHRNRVRIIFDIDGSRPFCDHGPMLLFERESKSDQRFFACSAYRDRKQCPAYVLEKNWKKSNNAKNAIGSSYLISRLKQFAQLQTDTLPVILQQTEAQRLFCATCGILSLDHTDHKSHKIIKGISDDLLQLPSLLLDPLDNAKKEAQFLFSDTSIEVLLKMLEQAGVTHVLCIAAPMIYQHIQKNSENLKSLMLDLDVRFRQFYSKEQYLLYNMFNHYFFDGDPGLQVYHKFLESSKDKLAVVVDPPFGGKTELLSNTLNMISQEYQRLHGDGAQDISMFVILPYFMEPQVVDCLPSMKMMDYKVEYRNHSQFQLGSKGRKQGSPVRIFTNVDLSILTLPENEGYRYCSICLRWISQENQHCIQCNSCTSKDGRTYVHCNICHRCVKPTWTHCNKCKRCALPDHPCQLFIEKSKQSKKRKISSKPERVFKKSIPR